MLSIAKFLYNMTGGVMYVLVDGVAILAHEQPFRPRCFTPRSSLGLFVAKLRI